MNSDLLRHNAAQYRAVMLTEVINALRVQQEERERIERNRAMHRNRNRVLVILVAWIATLMIPLISNITFHSVILATYAPSAGFTGDLIVTAYAWHRRY